MKTKPASSGQIAEDIDPQTMSDMRLGIFLDRANGKAFALILNPTNQKYSALTIGEHDITDSDDWDSVQEAINFVCEDIQRWSEQT